MNFLPVFHTSIGLIKNFESSQIIALFDLNHFQFQCCDIGQYQPYPTDYKAAVIKLLGKAVVIYSQRIQQFGGENMGLEGTHDKILEPLGDLRKAAVGPNQSYRSFSLGLNDHFLMPSSVEYHEDRYAGSVKERIIPLSSPPSINAHDVLSQVLFDVCPKECWELGYKIIFLLGQEAIFFGTKTFAFQCFQVYSSLTIIIISAVCLNVLLRSLKPVL